jgi:hypothetical protein
VSDDVLGAAVIVDAASRCGPLFTSEVPGLRVDVRPCGRPAGRVGPWRGQPAAAHRLIAHLAGHQTTIETVENAAT